MKTARSVRRGPSGGNFRQGPPHWVEIRVIPPSQNARGWGTRLGGLPGLGEEVSVGAEAAAGKGLIGALLTIVRFPVVRLEGRMQRVSSRWRGIGKLASWRSCSDPPSLPGHRRGVRVPQRLTSQDVVDTHAGEQLA